ncbi:MAG: hypothetical protein MK212_06635 [Saprospiraceae bacterium]|nr:hypothetical protein [Saprospiraceae bacterium]
MAEFILRKNIDHYVRYTVGGVIMILSTLFLVTPQGTELFTVFKQPAYVGWLLGGWELIVSILFLINKTKIWGAAGLLLSFIPTAYLHYKVNLSPWGLGIWILGIVFVLYYDRKRKILANSGKSLGIKN